MTRVPAALLALALLAAAGCSAVTAKPAVVANPDEAFLMAMPRESAAEIALSRIAVERAQSEAVKEYASYLIDDHEQMNRELEELASKKGLEVSKTPGALAAETATQLGNVAAADFDQEYMSEIAASHARAVAKVWDRSRLAKDPDVRSWARSAVPELRTHLRMARDIQRELAGGRAAAAAPGRGAAKSDGCPMAAKGKCPMAAKGECPMAGHGKHAKDGKGECGGAGKGECRTAKDGECPHGEKPGTERGAVSGSGG